MEAVKDHWRIDDEWWRQPVQRHYYVVQLDGGDLEVLFCDMLTLCWYRQKEKVKLHLAAGQLGDAVTFEHAVKREESREPAGDPDVR